MPRGVGTQHDTQVQDLGDAAVRVLAKGGLPALTFRNVAAEAGVSPGRVQHYTRTSKGLLALTFRHVRELTGRRVAATIASLRSPSGLEVVLATLRALIPQNEGDRTMLQVAAAVELHALTDAELADELRTGRAELIGFLAEQLRRDLPVGTGDDAPRSTADVAATLLATAEGLSALALTGTVESDEALRLLDISIRSLPWNRSEQ